MRLSFLIVELRFLTQLTKSAIALFLCPPQVFVIFTEIGIINEEYPISLSVKFRIIE